MENKAHFRRLSFLEFRDVVRQSLPLPSEIPKKSVQSHPSPASGEAQSSDEHRRASHRHEIPSSNWTERIRVTLGILKEKSTDVCIYEVPNELRNVNKEAYIPRIISIGPLHEGEHDLLSMEEYKWRYMMYLFQRTSEPSTFLDKCGNAIFKLEQKLRRCYIKGLEFNNYELIELMLVDGCFILELFLRFLDSNFKKDNDLIFRNAWMVPTLRHDLALLENQIPFIVLKYLFKIFLPHFPRDIRWCENMDILALSFFRPNLKHEGSCQDVKHLLDLMHKFYVPTYQHRGTKGKRTRGFRKCATKLLDEGIEFEKGEEDHLLDIKFSNGVLTIPPLHMNEMADSLVRNLIAYEQCSLGSTLHITSYAYLIRSLIHSARDVEFLLHKGIIINDLGGVEDVLAAFNSIHKEVILMDFYFSKLCDDVNKYQESWWYLHSQKAYWRVWWEKQRMALIRNYFSNAWRTISVIAAILLLFLTALHTTFVTLSYYKGVD